MLIFILAAFFISFSWRMGMYIESCKKMEDCHKRNSERSEEALNYLSERFSKVEEERDILREEVLRYRTMYSTIYR